MSEPRPAAADPAAGPADPAARPVDPVSGPTDPAAGPGLAGAAATAERRARVAAACVAVVALVAAVLVAHGTAYGPGHGVQPHGLFVRRWALARQIGLWWVLFAVGAAAVWRMPRRWAVPLVLAGALALRLAAFAPVAPLSDDLYRYAWDGKVQAAGVDPYRYAPTDPALDRLHDGWLWPDDAGCRQIHRRDGCNRLNRSTVRTIYPPVAEAFFLAEHAAGVDRAHDRGYEAAGLALDLAVIGLLLALLRAYRRDPRWLVLYAWSPVAVLEAVQNAHVDALGAVLALLAVALARRRPVWAAAVIGLAALVKLYPAVLLALVLRRHPAKTLAAFTGVVVAGYLPHAVATGGDVLGYLPGFLRENNYANGAGFLLPGLVGLRGAAATAVAAGALAAAGLWVLLDTTTADDRRACRLLGAFLLVTTPGAAWYALPLAAVAALGGGWPWLAVAAAPYLTYFSQSLDGAHRPLAAYGWVAALALLAGKGLLDARAGDRWGRVRRLARRDRPAGTRPPGARAGRAAAVGPPEPAAARPAGRPAGG